MRTSRQHALIALLLAIALVVTWLRPLDALAERSVEAGLKRALIAFASARTLNAALSAIKEASVSFQVGAGVTVKPGAVLEPLDQVVEQFSNLMFVATASLAVQRLMIEIFSSWPVCALVSLCLVGWTVFAWRLRAAPRWLTRLAIALLMLRLAVPVLAVAGEGVHWAVLERTYRPHATQLAAYEGADAGAAGASKPTTGENRESLLDKMKSLLAQGGDIARQVESLRTRAQDIVENLVRLAAVFTVQTLVLPLLYLGFLVWLYRTLTSPPTHPAGRSAGAPS